MVKRTDRLNSLVAKEIASIILKEFADERLRFASINRVKVTADLSFAKVFVSVIGDAHAREDAVKVLENSKGFIRHKLGERVRIRILPELVFVADDSIESGARVMDLIDKLSKERGEESAHEEGEGENRPDKEQG
jgi:ribosome-binding factor A